MYSIRGFTGTRIMIRGFASANLKGGTVVTAWNAYASGTIDDMMDERETDRFAIWFCLLLYNVALSAV